MFLEEIYIKIWLKGLFLLKIRKNLRVLGDPPSPCSHRSGLQLLVTTGVARNFDWKGG